MRYITWRILRGCCVLLCVSVLCFLAIEIAPGDFFVEARSDPSISADAIDKLREQHGLNRSLPVKYAHWAVSVLRGDWGQSLTYGTPVWPILWARAKNTLLLSGTATVAAWIITIAICFQTAFSSARIHSILLAGVSFLNAIPEIVIVCVLLLFAVRIGLLPFGGMSSLSMAAQSTGATIGDLAARLALPALALTLSALPQLLGHGLSAFAEVIDSPSVRAARTNGILRSRLICSYVLRLAANPLISLFGLSIGTLLSASLVVESAMAWPGIGRLLLEATLQRDIYIVIGAVILSSAFLVGGNLIADILLYLADPRIRHV